jgi:predicted nucleic acid-binding protein
VTAVFCDTSALFAMLDRDSAQHAEASAHWRDLVNGDVQLVTTNYVIVEMAALLQRRVGLDIVRRFQTDVVPMFEIVWIDQSAHARATEAMLTANRRQLSLVDCASFDTMRQLGIRVAFAFDQHFAEQGFERYRST